MQQLHDAACTAYLQAGYIVEEAYLSYVYTGYLAIMVSSFFP
jgi:hypothetical protein